MGSLFVFYLACEHLTPHICCFVAFDVMMAVIYLKLEF